MTKDRHPSDISVVVCVYTDDRWDDMVLAIDSLRQQHLKPLEIVMVVDHNPALLEKLRKHATDLTVVPNTDHQGLSGARNTGFRVSRGRKVAFLDDDARAEPDWLQRLDEMFSSDKVIGAGGHTDPDWVAGRPRWFPPSFDWTVGCSYTGLPTVASEVRNPIGCNMIMLRDVLEQVGGFRVGIGRVGTIPLGGEETEFAIRAAKALPGKVFMYAPQARILHKVPASRGTLRYFLRRCYAEGLSKAIIARLVGRQSSLASESAYATRVLPRQFFHHLASAVTELDPAGVLRAGAVVLGLLTTGLGYVAGVARPSAVSQVAEVGGVSPIA